jgi:hypothetical protein
MTVRSHVLSCLVAVVIAVTLAACGGSSAVTGSSEVAGPPSSTATVVGTVVASVAGSAETGDLRASSSSGGIRVSVSGTSLTTTTDDEGRFVLEDLTPGERVELRFEAEGIDARLEIEGLEAGQTLSVTVSVSGNTASMLSPGGEVEFRGRVESKAGDRLTVAGRGVAVGGATEILGRQNQPIPLDNVAVGAFVEVEGWPQPDGSVLAKKVKLEDGDGAEDANEVEFRGQVEAAGSSGLVVAGRSVTVDGMTELLGRQNDRVALSAITVGSFVEVEGWLQPDGSVLARKVKLEDDGEDEADEVEFTGPIQGLSPLTVAGRVVTTNGSTRVLDDDNNPIGLSGLAVGMTVEVEGWSQADGSVLAKKIKLED